MDMVGYIDAVIRIPIARSIRKTKFSTPWFENVNIVFWRNTREWGGGGLGLIFSVSMKSRKTQFRLKHAKPHTDFKSPDGFNY